MVEHGRHALQVHASLYRDRLALLQREALLALTVQALSEACLNPPPLQKNPSARCRRKMQGFSAANFWPPARHKNGPPATRSIFKPISTFTSIDQAQSTIRRTRKSFEVANHPFVDRCAFLLDSSFIEKARFAASRLWAISKIWPPMSSLPRIDSASRQIDAEPQ